MKFESLYKSTPLQDHKYAHNDMIKSSMSGYHLFVKQFVFTMID